ncbi:hypothetical protein EDB81DRAFT_99404 [Dactylonectria macrodidyma]|uniref:Uncharacterized protein n=1 Tax=Dactylonectria macrodidyma TaxID=307937 RepID=A0A9P9E9Q8_9HYPO|nr:hypothetical protein EDB81DRAFT_99404 [Dactylonectria macrodidyma]
MMDQALRSWQRCWGRTTEATLNPLSPNGLIPFNSTALLRIAYIRMNADLGPYRHVLIRNPSCLASSVASTPTLKLDRTTYTDIAVLQCIHALGIIVRSGIEFVSRTHTQSWSIVHSLSNIECACLLSLWLRSVADLMSEQGMQGLRKEETQLLRMTTSVVLETTMADDLEEEQNAVVRVRKLAACIVKVWVDSLKGEHMFQMVQTIAKGLSLAADILIAELDEEIQAR